MEGKPGNQKSLDKKKTDSADLNLGFNKQLLAC